MVSEDLSWAGGREKGPQRKDCSLRLLRIIIIIIIIIIRARKGACA